jgi:threonyl-tRNA synthetase
MEMGEVKIRLPDGSQRSYQGSQSYYDVASSIGPSLAKAALGVKVNGKVIDLSATLDSQGSDLQDLEIITSKSKEGLEIIRHSTAHILAMAVQKIWPGTQVTIGPVIENGFYYDFSFKDAVKISEKELPAIEEEMQKIIDANIPVFREVVARDHAVGRFETLGEHFKVEIVRELPEGEPISIYGMGEWFDLCRGPHIPSTGKAGAFKLTTVAGSYWRGDETKARLTRIYGTAWGSKKDLQDYLNRLEEAKKRDHRVLGKQLNLFTFHNEAPANAFFHPAGARLYLSLMNFMRRSNSLHGFQEVNTPLLMNVELWHRSGHYENYRENMYFTKVDESEAAIKPMNCPGHCLLYGATRHSYRELPIRLSEFGRVHRHERSGVTHGLMRVRTFVQDDAHVFCAPEQIEQEITRVLDQIDRAYQDLGFKNYRMELSTRPQKSIGSDEIWTRAEAALKLCLEKSGRPYKINPGDGAFYGPKIDFHLIDSIERSWQCGTVQLDFSMPSRFNLEFIGSDDKPHTPVMIHRAVLGSLERFMGIFIEHYAGHFPLWAAPVQVKLINISKDQEAYAESLAKEFAAQGVRVETDLRNEKLGFKIREAQLAKVPYMVVLGEKERETGTVSPRFWQGQQLEAMTPAAFVERLKGECGDLWGL